MEQGVLDANGVGVLEEELEVRGDEGREVVVVSWKTRDPLVCGA